MKKSIVAVLMLCVICSTTIAQQKKLGWSLGYYTTFDNNPYAPASLPWNAFTCVAYFQVIPNSNGTLGLPDATVAKNLIAAGHSKGKKVVFTIGGEGTGNGFTAACADGVRGKFISALIAYMKSLGYDGIDTDYEDDINPSLYLAFHKDLRDSINKLNPVPMLTVAAEDWEQATTTIAAYVNQINDMYYSASANDYLTKYFPIFTKAGAAKSQCGAGMGISMGNSVQMDTAICSMVINNGYGGIIQWAISNQANANANMTAIAAFVPVPGTTTLVRESQSGSPQASLFVNNEAAGSARQIGYSLPSTANISMVDLVVYDIKGAVVKTLVHGPSADHGVFNVPFKTAGAYVVKLSADSRVQATKEVVVR
jgi:Glycosyl hydrolases family 18